MPQPAHEGQSESAVCAYSTPPAPLHTMATLATFLIIHQQGAVRTTMSWEFIAEGTAVTLQSGTAPQLRQESSQLGAKQLPFLGAIGLQRRVEQAALHSALPAPDSD